VELITAAYINFVSALLQYIHKFIVFILC